MIDYSNLPKEIEPEKLKVLFRYVLQKIQGPSQENLDFLLHQLFELSAFDFGTGNLIGDALYQEIKETLVKHLDYSDEKCIELSLRISLLLHFSDVAKEISKHKSQIKSKETLDLLDYFLHTAGADSNP